MTEPLDADDAYDEAVRHADSYGDPTVRAAFINGIVTMHMLQRHGQAPASLGVRRVRTSDEHPTGD